MSEQSPLTTRAEVAAQAELSEIVKELKALRLRLRNVRASLPVPGHESLRPLQDEEDMDLSTEIRSVIECVLNDSLGPAIRDLGVVAAPQPSPEDEED